MRLLRILAVLCLAASMWGQVAVVPLNNPHVQYLSSAGAPLSGGKIYTYAAGTSSQIATYADANGTILNPNPVILDSSGSATIFLKTQAYKLVAQNALGVQQWAIDNIRSLAILGKPFESGLLAARPTTCSASIEFYVQTDSPYTLWQCNSSGTGWNGVSPTWIPPALGGAGQQLTVNLGAATTIWQSKPHCDVRDMAGAEVGAQVNACVSALGSSGGVIEIPAVSLPATATTLITLGKSQSLIVGGKGTLTTVGIRFSDSTTDQTGRGGLLCPEGATIALANAAATDLVSQTNFASLTGTTNTHGLFDVRIEGCTFDGNKATNASGYGIRLYGRHIRLKHVLVHDAKNDGIFLEGHDAAFSTYVDDDAQDGTYVTSINNGGNGIAIATQQGWTLTNGTTWGNGGWGLKTLAPMSINFFNTYLNASGGCWISTGGSIVGSGVTCTSAAVVGMLSDTAAGASVIAAGSFSCNGCTGLIIKNSNNIIQGQLTNSLVGIEFNNGGGRFDLAGFTNTTAIKCTLLADVPNFTFTSAGTGTVWDAGTCGANGPNSGEWNIRTNEVASNGHKIIGGSIYLQKAAMGTFGAYTYSGSDLGGLIFVDSSNIAQVKDINAKFAGLVLTPTAYNTATNCSSAASPAVCAAAAAGSVVVAAAGTTVTVNTTAVTANSQIVLTRDNSLSTKLSVTCNTQSSLVLGAPYVSARVANTSFTITIDAAPTTNPMCISYSIVN